MWSYSPVLFRTAHAPREDLRHVLSPHALSLSWVGTALPKPKGCQQGTFWGPRSCRGSAVHNSSCATVVLREATRLCARRRVCKHGVNYPRHGRALSRPLALRVSVSRFQRRTAALWRRWGPRMGAPGHHRVGLTNAPACLCARGTFCAPTRRPPRRRPLRHRSCPALPSPQQSMSPARRRPRSGALQRR
jgi:hypothetical protein